MKKIVVMATLVLVAIAIKGAAQVVAYSENFETATIPALPAGCTETHIGGGNGWVTHKGPIRWRTTDVSSHTQYAVVDDHNAHFNNPAKFQSTTFSLVGLSNPYLSFDYVYGKIAPIFGSPGENAWIDFSTDGGATFTTIDTLNMPVGTWTPYYKSLAAITPTANCKIRICYSDITGTYGEGMNGIAIDNILVYQPATTDLGLGWVTPVPGTVESYVNIGDSVVFSGLVANCGATATSSFTINWQAGASAPVSQYFSTPCGSFASTYYTGFAVAYHVTAAGAQNIKIWITVAGDTNPVNDTITTLITGVVPNVPVKRLFVEELTGTWCSWCVRGIVYMDSLWKEDSNKVSIASVHAEIAQDPMANDNISSRSYDTFTMVRSGMGYPSAIVDRRRVSPVQYGFSDFETDKKFFGFAAMGITKTIASGTLTANVTVKPALELAGDYRLELIVTEEDVSGTDVLYHQANAYSGSSTSMEGCGYNFNDSAAIIPAGHMKFHFVARATIPNRLVTGYDGVAGSLPATMHTNSYYSYTFDPITILPNWDSARLRCIALLIDNNPQSPNYGYVLNTANTTNPPLVDPFAATIDPAQQIDLKIYPNPATEEIKIVYTLSEAAETSITIYDAVGRKVITLPTRQAAAGSQSNTVIITGLVSGIYNVVLNTGHSRVAKLLSVIR